MSFIFIFFNSTSVDLTIIILWNNFVVEIMFRTVNNTNNIRYKLFWTVSYSFPDSTCFYSEQLSISVYQAEYSSYQYMNSGYQLRNSAYQYDNSGYQWKNSTYQCNISGLQCRNSPYQCNNPGYHCRKTPYQCRNSDQQWRKSASHYRNAGYQWRSNASCWEKTLSQSQFTTTFQGTSTDFFSYFKINILLSND